MPNIAQRAQVKVTQRLMTDQIKECGGVKKIFAKMQFPELSAAKALKKHKPNGNDQIVRVHAKLI